MLPNICNLKYIQLNYPIKLMIFILQYTNQNHFLLNDSDIEYRPPEYGHVLVETCFVVLIQWFGHNKHNSKIMNVTVKNELFRSRRTKVS